MACSLVLRFIAENNQVQQLLRLRRFKELEVLSFSSIQLIDYQDLHVNYTGAAMGGHLEKLGKLIFSRLGECRGNNGSVIHVSRMPKMIIGELRFGYRKSCFLDILHLSYITSSK